MHIRALPRRGPLSAIERFARPGPSAEKCEFCGATLAADHEHLAEPATRRLLCSCGPCSILVGGQASERYRRVPPHCQALPDLRIKDGLWAQLGIPVGLAFVYRNSDAKCVLAVYPSPAGPLESAVADEAWAEIVASNPEISDMAADVEALLVHRSATSKVQFRVSLDRCYELIGLVRTHWQGLSGGPTLWGELDLFVARLRSSSS